MLVPGGELLGRVLVRCAWPEGGIELDEGHAHVHVAPEGSLVKGHPSRGRIPLLDVSSALLYQQSYSFNMAAPGSQLDRGVGCEGVGREGEEVVRGMRLEGGGGE